MATDKSASKTPESKAPITPASPKHTEKAVDMADVTPLPVVEGLKANVLDYDDIVGMAPKLAGHRRLIEGVMKMLRLDKCNALHANHHDTPGPAFVKGVLEELDVTVRTDGEEVLDRMGDAPFITVSNHPLGALDGIVLIRLLTKRRPKFKVMVNMILNHITAMRPNFIAVDALASDDPKKKAVSMQGIKEAIMQVKRGEPLGFFPAGAVSKLNGHLQLEDREWQPTVIRLIQQLKVPVVPIYFHDSNSWWFNFLGRVSWQLRTLRLPAEVFGKRHKTMHVSIGDPITVDEIKAHSATVEELGEYLKARTYALRSRPLSQATGKL